MPTTDDSPRPEPPVASLPRVFVVTPSLDQAAYLRQAVDSVLAQDYPRLDHFVADGGSTDGSVDILRSYGDRVRWRSGPDGGQAEAINAAWRDSDAEIVAWLNSDDVYLPGAVSRAVAELARRPECALVYGRAWIIAADGEWLRPYPTRPYDAERLIDDNFICQPAAFLRRRALADVGLLDPALRYCMDYDLWVRLSRRFPLAYLDQELALSRVHDEAKTTRDRGPWLAETVAMMERNLGVAPRNWALACAIHDAHEAIDRRYRLLPERLRRRLRARRVQRFEARFVGPLYPDRWAGTATTVEVEPDEHGRVRLHAESPYWPHREPLVVTVEAGGQVLARREVERRGGFELDFELPATNGRRAGPVSVLLRANRTFVPGVTRDAPWEERPLSFMVR